MLVAGVWCHVLIKAVPWGLFVVFFPPIDHLWGKGLWCGWEKAAQGLHLLECSTERESSNPESFPLGARQLGPERKQPSHPSIPQLLLHSARLKQSAAPSPEIWEFSKGCCSLVWVLSSREQSRACSHPVSVFLVLQDEVAQKCCRKCWRVGLFSPSVPVNSLFIFFFLVVPWETPMGGMWRYRMELDSLCCRTDHQSWG